MFGALGGKTRVGRLVTLISTVVVVVSGLLVGMVGFLGRHSFAPEAIDKMFGITGYVTTAINKNVDSGYSRTFIFKPTKANPRGNESDAELLFHAGKKQFVYLTVVSLKNGARQQRYKVTIDGNDLDEAVAQNDQFRDLEVNSKLTFRNDPYHLHELSVSPKDIKEGEMLIVRCVVLVSNVDRHPD